MKTPTRTASSTVCRPFRLKNGQKKDETTYKDGKKHGLYTSWYDNGQKEKEATFKDGKELGPVTEKWYGYVRKYYVKEVQEWFENTIKDGKEHGPVTGWYGWYKNGQKEYEYEFTFKAGKLHGRYTEWYENGQKREETTCKAGKILSRKKWDEDGILTKEKTVNKADSHGLETHWHRNG